MIKLADCYRQTGNSVKAELWYAQVVKLREALPIHKFYYAEALMENGKYPEAKRMFASYLEIMKSDDRAKRLMNSCDSVVVFYSDTTQYAISLLPFNTSGTNNFSPVYYRSGIVFVSDRGATGKSKVKSNYTGKEYLDLFYVKKTELGNWLEPEMLRGNINGAFNEGPATFTFDYNIIYFTRNDYTGTNVNKNRRSFNNLKIFKGSFVGGEWNITSDLPFNNPEYSTAHPALSKSGNTLYFISDMPWGYGGTDIYSVKFINGRWTNPQNMGAAINSPGNELFPFVQFDSVLYFASDGNFGLGGLDIFQTLFNDNQWSTPYNLGYPVNSSRDDFGLIIDTLNREGYFTSKRYGGVDKIFSFLKYPATITLSGKITDSENKRNLAKVRIYVSADGSKGEESFSDSTGQFKCSLSPNKKYQIIIQKDGYFYYASAVSTIGLFRSASLNFPVALEKIKAGKIYRFYEVSFDKGETSFNSTSLPVLDSLVNWMKVNPKIKIEIGCHTDSRGSDKENLTLTQKRAEALADYFSINKIHPRRINSVGYGESKLLNGCVNGILCLDEDHAVNVRTEIKITGIE